MSKFLAFENYYNFQIIIIIKIIILYYWKLTSLNLFQKYVEAPCIIDKLDWLKMASRMKLDSRGCNCLI